MDATAPFTFEESVDNAIEWQATHASVPNWPDALIRVGIIFALIVVMLKWGIPFFSGNLT